VVVDVEPEEAQLLIELIEMLGKEWWQRRPGRRLSLRLHEEMSFEVLGRRRPLSRFEPALTPIYTHCLRWILGDGARNSELTGPLKKCALGNFYLLVFHALSEMKARD
jgi:hypothetical protein